MKKLLIYCLKIILLQILLFTPFQITGEESGNLPLGIIINGESSSNVIDNTYSYVKYNLILNGDEVITYKHFLFMIINMTLAKDTMFTARFMVDNSNLGFQSRNFVWTSNFPHILDAQTFPHSLDSVWDEENLYYSDFKVFRSSTNPDPFQFILELTHEIVTENPVASISASQVLILDNNNEIINLTLSDFIHNPMYVEETITEYTSFNFLPNTIIIFYTIYMLQFSKNPQKSKY